jgi:hypothetical protein
MALLSNSSLNYDPTIREPDTQNGYLNTNFKLVFSRIPNVEFWCSSANIPSINVGEVTIPTGILPIHVPGSSIAYDRLRITFAIDEEFSNWNEIHNWMRSTTPFEDMTEVLRDSPNYYSDATIICLNSAKRPNVRFNFQKVFPLDLDGFDLNVALSEPDLVTVNATFMFDSMSIETI